MLVQNSWDVSLCWSKTPGTLAYVGPKLLEHNTNQSFQTILHRSKFTTVHRSDCSKLNNQSMN